MFKKFVVFFLGLLLTKVGSAQVTGGKHVFDFLNLSAAPHVTALGGMNVAAQDTDISLIAQNPALLQPEMHTAASFNYAAYFANIQMTHFLFGYAIPSIQTNFAFGVTYFSYGEMTQTDAAGNVYGSFKPRDYVVQLVASRKYLARWYYGATIKFIASDYWQYRANGIAMDVGLSYKDTALGLQAGLVAKNMGVELKKYTPGNEESLPFDLQIGVSKRLRHLPLQLSATVHHLYQFDIRYADPAFDSGNGLVAGPPGKKFTADQFFRHFVLAAEFTIGRYVELTAAYNHLRRQELSLFNRKGMSGFSFGAGVVLPKLQVRYARSYYQHTGAFNQFGLNLLLDQFIGWGKWGQKIGWGGRPQ